MTESLFVVIGGLLAIAAATTVAPRVGIASPLLLVLLGIGVSFLPFVPDVEVEPHWILTVVLPPLLYSAAVSMPEMDFRREFTAIRGLSVVLVALCAVLLGVFFSAVIPGLSLAWGIALGAIVSPTDAVATQIVKRVGVSGRITAVLEGEGLLNDATALVILRTAVAAAAVSVSFGGVLWDFAFAVGAAVVIGFVVGHASMYVRARVKDPAVNTVVSFTVPFLAALPAEETRRLGPGGGGHRRPGRGPARAADALAAPPALRPRELAHGRADPRGRRLPRDGAGAVGDRRGRRGGARHRADGRGRRARAHAGHPRRVRRAAARRAATSRAPGRAVQVAGHDDAGAARRGRPRGARARLQRARDNEDALERFRTRIRRRLADIDYFLAEPLGWREGIVVVWAGMRGAITLAAAQTLPEDAPQRSLLILIAFLVAAGSLVIQGGTLPRVVALVKPAPEREDPEERERLRDAARRRARGHERRADRDARRATPRAARPPRRGHSSAPTRSTASSHCSTRGRSGSSSATRRPALEFRARCASFWSY